MPEESIKNIKDVSDNNILSLHDIGTDRAYLLEGAGLEASGT